MIWSIKHFKQYLFVVLIIDHQPLKWLKSLRDPPPKLARWVIGLQQYDFEVEYRAGKNHANAGTMSRISQIYDSKESPVDAQRTATESCVQTEPTPMVAMTTLASPTLDLLESQHSDYHQAAQAHQLEIKQTQGSQSYNNAFSTNGTDW